MEKILMGVYAIKNRQNGKMYIGSSVNVVHRWGVHKSHLNHNQHHSHLLQAEWLEQGKRNFTLEILEETAEEDLIEREQWYLDTYHPAYNTSVIASSAFNDPAIQARLPRGRDSRDYTPEHAAKISAALTGKKLSPEHRAHIGEAQQGRVMPPEQRERHSRIMKGNPKIQGPKSEQHIQAVSKGMSKKWEDPEYRAMMLEARRNRRPDKPRTEESRERERQLRSASRKQTWEKQKAEGYTGPERDQKTGRFLKDGEETAPSLWDEEASD